MRKCKGCKRWLDLSTFRKTLRTERNQYLSTTCHACHLKNKRQIRKLRTFHAPTSTNCQLCGRGGRQLVLDHCHESGDFRGFICSPCNRGLGLLGDDVDGLLQALLYLKNGSGSQFEPRIGVSGARRFVCSYEEERSESYESSSSGSSQISGTQTDVSPASTVDGADC